MEGVLDCVLTSTEGVLDCVLPPTEGDGQRTSFLGYAAGLARFPVIFCIPHNFHGEITENA